jgi:hypothetical protein
MRAMSFFFYLARDGDLEHRAAARADLPAVIVPVQLHHAPRDRLGQGRRRGPS